MNSAVANIDKLHRTKQGKIVFGTAELLIAYVFLSRAIDTGSLWQYGAAILLFIGGLNNLVRAALQLVKPNAKKISKKR